jgi:hypothetical protein
MLPDEALQNDERVSTETCNLTLIIRNVFSTPMLVHLSWCHVFAHNLDQHDPYYISGF